MLLCLCIYCSITLANAYLGYQNWCTRIENIERLVFAKVKGSENIKCTYICKMQLVLKASDQFVYAYGKGTSVGKRVDAVKTAYKKAVTAATKAALYRVAVAKIGEKKAVIFIPPTNEQAEKEQTYETKIQEHKAAQEEEAKKKKKN